MPTTTTNVKLGIDRRERMLAFMREFEHEHGHPATVREIMAAVGLSSTETTYRHLLILVDEERVRRVHVTSKVMAFRAAA